MTRRSSMPYAGKDRTHQDGDPAPPDPCFDQIAGNTVGEDCLHGHLHVLEPCLADHRLPVLRPAPPHIGHAGQISEVDGSFGVRLTDGLGELRYFELRRYLAISGPVQVVTERPLHDVEVHAAQLGDVWAGHVQLLLDPRDCARIRLQSIGYVLAPGDALLKSCDVQRRSVTDAANSTTLGSVDAGGSRVDWRMAMSK